MPKEGVGPNRRTRASIQRRRSCNVLHQRPESGSFLGPNVLQEQLFIQRETFSWFELSILVGTRSWEVWGAAQAPSELSESLPWDQIWS